MSTIGQFLYFSIFDHVTSHGILIISWGTRIPKDFHSAKFHPALGILAIDIANLTFFPYTLLSQAFYPQPPSLPRQASQPTPKLPKYHLLLGFTVNCLRLLKKRSYSAQFSMTQTVNWSISEGFAVVLSSCMLCANIMCLQTAVHEESNKNVKDLKNILDSVRKDIKKEIKAMTRKRQ